MKEKIRVLVEDISFSRFCKELVERVKEYLDANLAGVGAGDSSRVEGAFMFSAILEGEKK